MGLELGETQVEAHPQTSLVALDHSLTLSPFKKKKKIKVLFRRNYHNSYSRKRWKTKASDNKRESSLAPRKKPHRMIIRMFRKEKKRTKKGKE